MSIQPKATRIRRANMSNQQSINMVALSSDDQAKLDDATSAIEGMNLALKAVFEDLKGNFQTNDSTGLTFFYQIGTTLLEVKEDRTGEIYGKNGYRRLCKALDYNINIADKACIFAKQYEPDEVQAIASLRNSVTGKGINCEHMRHLLVDYLSDSVDPETHLSELKTSRMGYIRRCIAGSWSAKQLKDIIMEEHDREHVGGRNHAMIGKEAALSKLNMFHIQGINAMRRAWCGEENNIITLLTTNYNDITPDTITLLNETVEHLKEYQTFLNALVRQFDQADLATVYANVVSATGTTPDAQQTATEETLGTSNQAVEPLDLELDEI